MTVSVSPTSKKSFGRMLRDVPGWLFISPWIIGFLAFSLYPFLASLFYSFTNYDILNPPKWIGLANYVGLVHDPLFWTALYNTIYYTIVTVPLSTVIAIALAMLLNMNVKGLPLYRTIFYLPAVVPAVASSILWLWLFNPSFGLLDSLLRGVGLPAPGWVFSVAWAKPALIIMGLWGLGAPMVIYLASLQGVPQDLYEAASIEGAGTWAKIRNVTIPFISPVILFNVILGLIGAFQIFTQAYVMTSGGPSNSTLFYALYMYEQAFQFLHMGYASAMAWVMFALIMLATLLIFRSSARWVYYGGE